MNHFKYTWILLIIGIVATALVFTDYTFSKLATKAFNLSLLLFLWVRFTKYWIGKNNDADALIFKDSIATAILLGLLAIAISITIAFG